MLRQTTHSLEAIDMHTYFKDVPGHSFVLIDTPGTQQHNTTQYNTTPQHKITQFIECDLTGHRDFEGNMFRGAALADHALVVISADTYEFAAFELDIQHDLLIALTIGLKKYLSHPSPPWGNNLHHFPSLIFWSNEGVL